jgi:Family of unknown function (DUF6492)
LNVAHCSSFRHLQSNRTNIVAKEEVLPLWVHRVDTLKAGLRSNVWVQARGRPIRGWLLQQLVKLAVAEQLSGDVLVYADSDVVLIRPFSADAVSITSEAGMKPEGYVELLERHWRAPVQGTKWALRPGAQRARAAGRVA